MTIHASIVVGLLALMGWARLFERVRRNRSVLPIAQVRS